MKNNYPLFTILTICLIITTNLSILGNIPYIRQITSYILLMFIPGFIILKMLKLNRINALEKIVLSVGLSIVFVIFVGLLTNFTFPSNPLSSINVLLVFDIILLIFLFIGYYIDRNSIIEFHTSKIRSAIDLNSYDKLILILSFLLPTLSVFGTYLAKSSQNYICLYLMVFLIPILIIFVCLTNEKIKKNMYPISLFSISLSIILAYTLISNYIYGSDSHSEFYLFSMVLNTGKWQIFETLTNLKPLDSALGISLLPTLYQLFLNFPDSTMLFKLLYVLPLSLTPLVVYQISKNYFDNLYAFLAAIFVITSAPFLIYQTAAYRTYLAVFLFSLAIMVFLTSNLKDSVKKLLFIIFSFGIIFSHYSTSYIFLFLILASIIIMQLLKILIKRRGYLDKNESSVKKKEFITFGVPILIFSIMFLWYSQITTATFDSGLSFLSKTFGQMGQFLILDSRDPVVSQALGNTLSDASLTRYINFVTSWMSIISITVGILAVLLSFFNLKIIEKFHFLLNLKIMDGFKIKYVNKEFFSLGASSFLLLIFGVTIPYVLIYYNINRFYYMLIIILAFFFIVGSRIISNSLRIKKNYIFILIVLIPLLVSYLGITPQFFGTPDSILLNPAININDSLFIYDQEASGAHWISNYRDINKKFFTDEASNLKLVSVGFIPRENIEYINKYSDPGYIYLSYYNIKYGKIDFHTILNVEYNITDYSNVLNQENQIFDSGYNRILEY